MKSVVIIAEAGVNHNGDLKLAEQLVDAASAAGADYVKFQTFKASELTTPDAPMASYQEQNLKQSGTQQDMLKKLELSPEQHHHLIRYCEKKGIKFFSTAFDFGSFEFLKSLKLGVWKIPSGEITNWPFLKSIAALNEKTYLSTGMSELHEVEAAVNCLLQNGLQKDRLCVLHCNSDYPTPMHDVNLLAMAELGKKMVLPFGYSDHTLGIEIPVAAVALGAVVVEKHFTLDRNLPGPDHKASLLPEELKAMVAAIRNIEKALGSPGKKPSSSEIKNRDIVRKSIVARVAIAKGEQFTEKNLTVRRPGTGLSPMKWEKVIGQKAHRQFQPNEMIDEA